MVTELLQGNKQLGSLVYEYQATLIRIVSPITLRLDIDLGLETRREVNIRLDGVTLPDNPTRAGAYTRDWLDHHPHLTVRTIDRPGSWHGRWLGIVSGDDGQVLNSMLLKAGLVEPWKQPAGDVNA